MLLVSLALGVSAVKVASGKKSGGASCSTALDCWLNGDCVNSVCICDKTWFGSSCNLLSELPSTQLWPPPDQLWPAPNTATLASSWGATIAKDDAGLFHGFFDTVCRTFTWMHIEGAVITHATSTALEGPYEFSDIALPQQSMTPHIVRDTDGAWLLLHERNASVFGDPLCTGAPETAASQAPQKPPNETAYDGPPSVARSLSLYGPWEPHDFNFTPPLPGRTTPNPNPSLLPLGPGAGYMLAFTSQPIASPYSEAISFAHADDWLQGYFVPIVGNGAPAPSVLDCEDPFLYRTDRGLHVVCHRRATVGPNPWNFSAAGGYGVSADGGANWTFSPTPIYTTTVPWARSDGAPLTFGRRERPEFIMGEDGRPAYLLTGVELVTGEPGHPSLSIITPLGPPPAPTPPPRWYSVTVGNKSATPVLSSGLPQGHGYSPCTQTFNPAYLEAHPPGLNASIVLVRASGCTEEFGGAEDHLLYAACSSDGTCGDVQPLLFPFEYLAEDPRVTFNEADRMWYLYYFANGTNQSTVFLRRSPTPLLPESWEPLASALPWHRNGCAFLSNGVWHVLYGETYGGAYPGHYLGGIGLAMTQDWSNYTTLNATLLNPDTSGPEPEVCLEAATPPVRLSSGDWFHFFAAGTPGWGPWGPGIGGQYIAGWVVLDGADPTRIVQRSVVHPFAIDMDYEIGNNPAWPVYRNNTVFVTSLIPVEGEVDTFRAWYGAADANVATAIVKISMV